MRPTSSSTWAAACSSVSLPFLTRRAIWPWVTLRASASPASTSSWLMSFRTTGMPAAAMVCAIWPPMGPAPTTAALKTNMMSPASGDVRGAGSYGTQLEVALELAGEAGERPGQRVADRPADEQHVDDLRRD